MEKSKIIKEYYLINKYNKHKIHIGYNKKEAIKTLRFKLEETSFFGNDFIKISTNIYKSQFYKLNISKLEVTNDYTIEKIYH